MKNKNYKFGANTQDANAIEKENILIIIMTL